MAIIHADPASSLRKPQEAAHEAQSRLRSKIMNNF